MARTLLVAVAAVLLFRAHVARAQPPIGVADQTPSNADEIALQRERLALDRSNADRSARIEYLKAAITGVSIFIPLIAAVIVARSQARASFELKAAELVLGSPDPYAARKRADVVKTLFPARLPRDFADAFQPEDHAGVGPSAQSKLELLKLIAANPAREQDLVVLWRRMYPGDSVDKLFPGDTPSSKTRGV